MPAVLLSLPALYQVLTTGPWSTDTRNACFLLVGWIEEAAIFYFTGCFSVPTNASSRHWDIWGMKEMWHMFTNEMEGES